MQVAVDHPSEIVQAFAGGQGQGRHAFRLIHFAVTEYAPHVAVGGVQQAAMLQVTHESRLENRTDRADAHGTGGELPEVGHQPRVWVAGEPARAGFWCSDLLPIMGQVVFAQAPFEKGTRVNTGRRMRLVEHQVAAEPMVAGAKEVVEADFEQIRRTGVTGDMPTEFAIRLVGPYHHGQGIPTHQRGHALFGGEVAGKGRLLLDADAVDIRRAVARFPVDSRGAAFTCQQVENLPRPRRTGIGHQRRQSVTPFVLFYLIHSRVTDCTRETVHGHLRAFFPVYVGARGFFDCYPPYACTL